MTDYHKNKALLDNITHLIEHGLAPELNKKKEILYERYSQQRANSDRNRLFKLNNLDNVNQSCQCHKCRNNKFIDMENDILFYDKIQSDLARLLTTLSQMTNDDESTLNDVETILIELNDWLNRNGEKTNIFTSLPERLSYEWLPMACVIVGVLIVAAGYTSLFTLLLLGLIPIANEAAVLSSVLFLAGIVPITGFSIAILGNAQTASKLHTDVALLCLDIKKLQVLDDKHDALWSQNGIQKTVDGSISKFVQAQPFGSINMV